MVFYPFYISKRKLSQSSWKPKWTVCMQQSDILFPEKHSTVYLEHPIWAKEVERAIILRSGIWGLNYLYKTAFKEAENFATVWIISFKDIQELILKSYELLTMFDQLWNIFIVHERVYPK